MNTNTILDNNIEIKCYQNYKYLGSSLSQEGTSEEDIRYKTAQGWNAIRRLNSLLWSTKMKLSTKTRIGRSIVEPIATNGSEYWQINSRQKTSIEVMEMDYLRRAWKCQESSTSLMNE